MYLKYSWHTPLKQVHCSPGKKSKQVMCSSQSCGAMAQQKPQMVSWQAGIAAVGLITIAIFFGSAAVDCFNTTAAAAIVTNRRWICGWLVASSSMSDLEYSSKSRSKQPKCSVHCSTTNEFPLNAENENCEKHCTIGKQMTCTSKWISK